MMNVLIIEDEEPAAERLQKLLKEMLPEAVILNCIVSIASAIDWFVNNQSADLIFCDIQLSDGLSFEIFKKVEVQCPVIFITAYDQYAINAFKVNSIDYLLKPVKKNELQLAVDKFKKHYFNKKNIVTDFNHFFEAYDFLENKYKSRFISRYGEHIKTIKTEEVAYFFTHNKINFLHTFEGRRYPVDFNLESLETLLDPKNFFRINRQYIISINAIKEMFSYSKSRILIKLDPPAKDEAIVSTERSGDFKLWLGDER